MKNTNSQSQPAELERILGEIGLSDMALKLYLLLSSSAGENFSILAKRLGISRPHLYKLISELEMNGLLVWNKTGAQNTRLQLASPAGILQKIRDKKREIDSMENSFVTLLPKLLEQYSQGGLSSKVRIMTNEEEFLELFFQILDEADGSIDYFGSAADLIGFISWEKEKKWIQKRLARNIHINVLILPSDDARTLKQNDKKELRETRIFMSSVRFPTSFHLFGNKVVFWQPNARNAIVIEDEFIVQMLRAMYGFCWEKSGI